jgi:hypothetical protein
MGISKLLPHLPRGREKQTRFIHCKHLVAGQKLDIDAGTLIFTCALEHRETFNQGIYKPAVTSFLGKLVVLRTAYEWDFTIVFDGYTKEYRTWIRKMLASQYTFVSCYGLGTG